MADKFKLTLTTEKRTEYDRDKREVTLYGRTPGHTCGDCAKLKRDSDYIKTATERLRCTLSEPNARKSWKASWQACGFFEERAK